MSSIVPGDSVLGLSRRTLRAGRSGTSVLHPFFGYGYSDGHIRS